MRFRTILVVSDVAIREDTQITLSYQSTHPITIAIEKDDVGDRARQQLQQSRNLMPIDIKQFSQP